ncbi:MAG: cyclohexadieny/prephenate dehydrogenase [Chthoniobacter sp.]|jgi:prephenate dehydrogenase|nr:cyclohexadieny/prephenate dehydrogenase [Chthoniobacter sp.]
MINLAIVGPGLLGGSIALAARHRYRVALWARRAEAVTELEAAGIGDRASTDLRSVVADADLVVLCVPVGAMPALAREVAAAARGDALVTDVGSVKAPLCEQLGAILGGRFVGSHPMAGSEQTGLAAARADLFADAVTIVTPDARTELSATAAISGFWTALGCRVLQLSPGEHDEIVALVSHLPHLLAATLVNTVAAKNAQAFDFCGPGFRDTTRVAGGPPAMWAEILGTNRDAVGRAVEALIENLREIVRLLDRDRPMTDFLTLAKAQRDRLRLPKTPHA